MIKKFTALLVPKSPCLLYHTSMETKPSFATKNSRMCRPPFVYSYSRIRLVSDSKYTYYIRYGDRATGYGIRGGIRGWQAGAAVGAAVGARIGGGGWVCCRSGLGGCIFCHVNIAAGDHDGRKSPHFVDFAMRLAYHVFCD